MEETIKNTLTSSNHNPEKPTVSLMQSNKGSHKPITQLKKPQWNWVPKQAMHNTHVTTNHYKKLWHKLPLCQQKPYKAKPSTKKQLIWVPKMLLQAQAGSVQKWIPKRIPRERNPHQP